MKLRRRKIAQAFILIATIATLRARLKLVIVVVILSMLTLSGALSCAAAPPQLRYVVIITRHGVRSPLWNSELLNQYSAEPWPEWGVAPGELTPHGRALVKLMGAYYLDRFAREGLLKRQGCGDAARIYMWADTDQRTIETGRALSESLAPGCGIPVHSLEPGHTDPLFEPIKAGLANPDPEMAVKAVRDRLGAQPQMLLEAHRSAFDALQSVLTGGRIAPKRLSEPPWEIGVAIVGKSADLTGPFSTASTLGEDLLLEYADGIQGENLGWGRLNSKNLFQILELHAVYAELERRTSYLARAGGSNLMAHAVESMEQAATGKPIPGALGHPGDAILILSGHDTNLSNISGILGLTWHLPGYQPDDTPPGGALLLSLWQQPGSGKYFVRLQYLAQTLDQMRDATPLTLAAPPAEEQLVIPGCGEIKQKADCSWQMFRGIVQHSVDPRFVFAEAAAPAVRAH